MIRNYNPGMRRSCGSCGAPPERRTATPRWTGGVPADPDGKSLFQPEHTFVLTRENRVAGFVNGCVDERIPRGAERGYVGCLLLGEGESTQENAGQLLAALEDSFRKKGPPLGGGDLLQPHSPALVVPGTPGHQHNNLPGFLRICPCMGG